MLATLEQENESGAIPADWRQILGLYRLLASQSSRIAVAVVAVVVPAIAVVAAGMAVVAESSAGGWTSSWGTSGRSGTSG